MAKCIIELCGNQAIKNGRCRDHRLGTTTRPGINNKKSTFIILVKDKDSHEVAINYKTYSALKREFSSDKISVNVSKRRVRGGYKFSKTFKINATDVKEFNIKRYAD